MLAFAVALLYVAQDSQHNTLTPQERKEGWTLLFDGKSTEGWLEVTGKPFPAAWRIEDGCLRAVDPGSGYQDIRTTAEFAPAFEFQFDWKIGPKGNSGVKYFVQRIDEWNNAKGRQARARGVEYQLYDDKADPNQPGIKITGSVYDAVAPSATPARPLGEFNHSLIRVQGHHIEHWLNGVKIIDTSLDAPAVLDRVRKEAKKDQLSERSFLSLQNHGTPVWFRDLKVRTLSTAQN